MESSIRKSLGVRKGAWTKEEDNLLRICIQKYGEGKWHQVPIRAGLNRCRKSCRLRWLNYLRPNIKRGYFATDEVDLIVRLHKLLGNKWSLIAGRLPGRTANDVKNFWNTHAEKKLSFEQGIKINHKLYPNKINNVEKPNTFTPNHIIKPRPRMLSKVLNENGPVKIAEDKMQVQNQVSEYSSQENKMDDDCTEWWSKLLGEQTENNNETIMAPKQAGETSSSSGLGDHEGSFFSIEELDVWELLN